jgi:hypothetical protein
MKHDIGAISAQFRILGQFIDGAPYGSGHINDTYAVIFDQGGTQVRYILQRINHLIFKNPPALMENIARVTRHIASVNRNRSDASRRSLTVIPALDGAPFYCCPEGTYWRAYVFIENAKTYDIIETPVQAEKAARAFGEFQKCLVDLPGERLHETIPDFHNTPARFAKFEKSLAEDRANRAALARPEIDFVLKKKEMTGHLLRLHSEGRVPERITHNDTKLNNVMIDGKTSEGICVIDLDTVMPGLALYDFGDLVRTSTSPAAEDERDLRKVSMQMPMYEALVRGYLASAGDFLTPDERANLAFGGKLITFEIGLRFLTDFLDGDIYFKVKRENHNLDRCRTQFRLVECIEQNEEAMNKFAASL